MADLDPALVERMRSMLFGNSTFGTNETVEAVRVERALLSLGIPAAALNALAKGEAVVVPKVRTREMITATPFLEDSWDAQLAASPYRSEP